MYNTYVCNMFVSQKKVVGTTILQYISDCASAAAHNGARLYSLKRNLVNTIQISITWTEFLGSSRLPLNFEVQFFLAVNQLTTMFRPFFGLGFHLSICLTIDGALFISSLLCTGKIYEWNYRVNKTFCMYLAYKLISTRRKFFLII